MNTEWKNCLERDALSLLLVAMVESRETIGDTDEVKEGRFI